MARGSDGPEGRCLRLVHGRRCAQAPQDADDAKGPERAAHLEVPELRCFTDAGDVALTSEVADDEKPLRGQRHLLQPLLIIVGALVVGVRAADAALDAAPGLDPPDT